MVRIKTNILIKGSFCKCFQNIGTNICFYKWGSFSFCINANRYLFKLRPFTCVRRLQCRIAYTEYYTRVESVERCSWVYLLLSTAMWQIVIALHWPTFMTEKKEEMMRPSKRSVFMVSSHCSLLGILFSLLYAKEAPPFYSIAAETATRSAVVV